MPMFVSGVRSPNALGGIYAIEGHLQECAEQRGTREKLVDA